jgi:hypothetical protein
MIFVGDKQPMTAQASPYTMQEAGDSLLRSPARLALFALVLSIARFWPSIVTVWTTGAYDVPADAMRMVEVRDLLNGQAWFDLHQYRLDPPLGVDMHWTRVLDVPLAALIKSFSLFLPVADAERLTRIVFPLALLFGFYATIISTARRLAGPAAMLPAAIIAVLSSAIVFQFEPGRIHHHGVQILLIVLILRATIETVATRTLVPAGLAAGLAALSLSINVENVTYVAVEIGAFALLFVVEGEAFAAPLMGFAVSLALSSLFLFVATTGPSHYFMGACDAFSTPHLLAIVIGAAALAAMAASANWLKAWPLRLSAAGFGGVVVIGALAYFYPACLGDPLVRVDPLLRQYWLSHAAESQPLGVLIRSKPSDFLYFVTPPLLGFGAALIAAWRARDARRKIWLIVAAFATIGFLTALWQLRALPSASAIALLGGAWLSAQVVTWTERRTSLIDKPAIILAVLPFCSAFWGIVESLAAPAPSDISDKPAIVDAGACRSQATILTLDKLPKSLIMAGIDMGAEILAYTDHAVLAAPYHRNNHGNGEFVRAMLAPPDEARTIVEASGAAYFVFCPALPEFEGYAAGNRDGLAAKMMAGRAPHWLQPASATTEGPVQVYEIR